MGDGFRFGGGEGEFGCSVVVGAQTGALFSLGDSILNTYDDEGVSVLSMLSDRLCSGVAR